MTQKKFGGSGFEHKAKILDLIGEGFNTTDSLFDQMKKKQPSIERHTIRARLFDLRKTGQIDEQGSGYRIV